MPIGCGRCKGKHETVAEVRDCFGKPQVSPATPRQLNYAHALLRQRVVPAEFEGVTEETINTFGYVRMGNFLDIMTKQPFLTKKDGIDDGSALGDLMDKLRVPDGRYALKEEGAVYFYRVSRSNDGWPANMWILRGSPGSLSQEKMRKDHKVRVLEEIGQDPAGASRLFGKELEYCGVCNSPLTNKKSREYGIGPKCRKDRGW